MQQDYYESLEEALQGGVTVVQVREKDVDTGEVSTVHSVSSWSAVSRRYCSFPLPSAFKADEQFVEIARRTKEITDKVSFPRVRDCRRPEASGRRLVGFHRHSAIQAATSYHQSVVTVVGSWSSSAVRGTATHQRPSRRAFGHR